MTEICLFLPELFKKKMEKFQIRLGKPVITGNLDVGWRNKERILQRILQVLK